MTKLNELRAKNVLFNLVFAEDLKALIEQATAKASTNGVQWINTPNETAKMVLNNDSAYNRLSDIEKELVDINALENAILNLEDFQQLTEKLYYLA